MSMIRRELPQSALVSHRTGPCHLLTVQGSPFITGTSAERTAALPFPYLMLLVSWIWNCCPMAEMKPTSSRATATTATLEGLPRLVRR